MSAVITTKERLEQLAYFERTNEAARKARLAEEQRTKDERTAVKEAAKKDYWVVREAEYVVRLMDASVAGPQARQWAKQKVEAEQYAMADIDPVTAARASLMTAVNYGHVPESTQRPSGPPHHAPTSNAPAPRRVERSITEVIEEIKQRIPYGAHLSRGGGDDPASES